MAIHGTIKQKLYKSKAVNKIFGDYTSRIKINELRRLARYYPPDDNWHELMALDLQRQCFLDSLKEQGQ